MVGYERYKYVKYYDENGNLLLPSEALVNARYTYVLGDDGEPSLREIMVCSLPKFNANGYGLLSDGRCQAGRRAEPSEAENAAPPKSEWRSRHRAIVAIRDILDCNVFEWFVTLTLDKEKVGSRYDYSEFIRHLRSYFSNGVQRHGWKYLAVPEFHKDGALHLHAVVSGDLSAVYSGTVSVPDRKKPITEKYARRLGYSDNYMQPVYNLPNWHYGFSTALRVYGDRKALRNYIAKYITKDSQKIGGRYYFSGGSLSRPVYEYGLLDFDSFKGHYEIHTDGGDFKVFYTDRETPQKGE
jgi:hypothetical protein